MKASDIHPVPIIHKSDVTEERFNELLKVVQEQEQRIERLEQRPRDCQCMNCIVIG